MRGLPRGYGPAAEDDEQLRPLRRQEDEDVNPSDAADEAERTRETQERRAAQRSASLFALGVETMRAQRGF